MRSSFFLAGDWIRSSTGPFAELFFRSFVLFPEVLFLFHHHAGARRGRIQHHHAQRKMPRHHHHLFDAEVFVLFLEEGCFLSSATVRSFVRLFGSPARGAQRSACQKAPKPFSGTRRPSPGVCSEVFFVLFNAFSGKRAAPGAQSFSFFSFAWNILGILKIH